MDRLDELVVAIVLLAKESMQILSRPTHRRIVPMPRYNIDHNIQGNQILDICSTRFPKIDIRQNLLRALACSIE